MQRRSRRSRTAAVPLNVVLGLGLLVGLAAMATGVRDVLEAGLAQRGMLLIAAGLTSWILLADVGQRIRRRTREGTFQ